MKKKYIVIGYKEVSVKDMWDNGTKEFVLGTYIGGPYTDINHAEDQAAEQVKNFELGIEIKTVFVKD